MLSTPSTFPSGSMFTTWIWCVEARPVARARPGVQAKRRRHQHPELEPVFDTQSAGQIDPTLLDQPPTPPDSKPSVKIPLVSNWLMPPRYET